MSIVFASLCYIAATTTKKTTTTEKPTTTEKGRLLNEIEHEQSPFLKQTDYDKFAGKTTKSGSWTKIIVIIVVIVILLVAGGVTFYAYQQKILCFEQADSEGDEEATGKTPLLKETASASQVSPSRTTVTNTSRPSGTTISGNY